MDYINNCGASWGADGAQFKNELAAGDAQICYADDWEEQTGDSAWGGWDQDGTWTVIIDSKYYGDGFKLMLFILHEMAHRRLHGDEPEDPIANACEEAEADCEAAEGIAAAAQAAGPPYPPGFCEGLLELRDHYVAAWELCNTAWFPGFPADCPELGQLMLEVCQ